MPPGYHHSGFVATHALEHMMYGYSLLVPMNQRVLSKLSKEHNISKWSWVIHDTQSAQISQKQDERNIYAIMKIMRPPGYHRNGIVATHEIGHMMYGYTLLVTMNQRVLNKLSKDRNISGHKWSSIRRVPKSQKVKISVTYLQSWKQCALPVITTMALWQLMHLGTWCTFTHCWYKWTKECSSWLHIYFVHLEFERLGHSVCRGSRMTIYITLLA